MTTPLLVAESGASYSATGNGTVTLAATALGTTFRTGQQAVTDGDLANAEVHKVMAVDASGNWKSGLATYSTTSNGSWAFTGEDVTTHGTLSTSGGDIECWVVGPREDTPLFALALGDESTAHSAAVLATSRVSKGFVVTRIYLSLTVTPSTNAFTLDVLDNTTSILAADMSIATSAYTDETSSFAASAIYYEFSKGDIIKFECTQADAAAAGAKVYLFGYWT